MATAELLKQKGYQGQEISHAHDSPKRRGLAIAPLLLTWLNAQRTIELAGDSLKIPVTERIDQAIEVMGELQKLGDMPDQRRWTISMLEAARRGPSGFREFFINQGVFNGGSDCLFRPEVVVPGMEFANLNPNKYSDGLAIQVDLLARRMFSEYFAVKNALSAPEIADILVSMAGLPAFGSLFNELVDKLPPPRLKPSLLLMPHVNQVIKEVNRLGKEKLVAVFGIGKGEELVWLIKAGCSVVCFDAHDYDFLSNLFAITFKQAGIEKPPIRAIGKTDSEGKTWTTDDIKTNRSPSIFIVGGIDLSQPSAIAEELAGVAPVSACIYLLHEIPNTSKPQVLHHMAKVSSGSLVVTDGLPDPAAFDRIITKIGYGINVRGQSFYPIITGCDAAITHILGLPAAELLNLLKTEVSDRHWGDRVKLTSPRIPKIIYPLQAIATGRKI